MGRKKTLTKNSQYIVIGLGRFGQAVARTLYQMGKDVLAVDTDRELINDAESYSTHAVAADASEENVLVSLGVKNFDVAVIGIGSVHASVLATLICKEQGVGYVIAKAINAKHKTILEKVGADKVIIPEDEMGVKIANMLTNSKLSDIMELTDDYLIVESEIPDEWIGKNLIELNLRKKVGVNVMLIKRSGEVIINPPAEIKLLKGDMLIVGGANDDIKSFSDLIK
ncbi:MAG: TrkA family potassium uptake protein [Clostridiales bacterium]|jgi:trk system potassium uptake protein TrkA|nr:TrkA family potassium uptake protein [Clostridiales bacterium]